MRPLQVNSLALAVLVAGTVAGPATPASDAPAQAWIWSDAQGKGDFALAQRLLEARNLPFHVYDELGMLTFLAAPEAAQAIGRLTFGRIDANQVAELHLDRSVPYIGADGVARQVGLARTGPSVLVLDTGVDSSHPDFRQGNLAANVQADRTGGLVVGSQESLPVVDLAGHGTHVAGIVGGSGESFGAQDPLHGEYLGVYAVGRLIGYQASSIVQDDDDIGVDIAAALEAFDWALANREQYDIRVITNSWGVPGNFDPDHPVNQATLRAYLAGMVVVFSAGNAGEDGAGTLNAYCQSPWVLCVAAGDLDGRRTGFSSYGRLADPAKPWDHPDLTAPGLTIRAAAPPALAVGTGTLVNLAGGRPPSESLYVDRSGTSMAAPHVAGAAALLQAAFPALSPDQVMDILVVATRPMSDSVAKVGAGYLDVAAAYEVAASADGNRNQFLAGKQVKYAGPVVGDTTYANDPVSVGYDGLVPPSALLLRDRTALWVATPVAWVLLGLATLLVVVALVRGRAR